MVTGESPGLGDLGAGELAVLVLPEAGGLNSGFTTRRERDNALCLG